MAQNVLGAALIQRTSVLSLQMGWNEWVNLTSILSKEDYTTKKTTTKVQEFK